MRATGLTYRQLRRRLGYLEDEGKVLTGQVVKERNGRLRYSVAVLEMLREVAPLADGQGMDNRQAVKVVAEKIVGNGGNGQSGKAVKAGNVLALETRVELLERMAEDLRRERDDWRTQFMKLQEQLAVVLPMLTAGRPTEVKRAPRRFRLWPWSRASRN